MKRVVCVWLPTWPTDRLRRSAGAQPPASPIIVAERKASRRVVVAADVAAQALGIRLGMTVALAQATTPGLTVVEADAQADAAALEKLAVWALRYSPLVAADAPDGLVLDITGASHLFGGEATLLADLGERLARAGIAARMAIAETWAAAWGLARFAPGTITANGQGLEAVAHLPVSALRVDPDLVAALRALGFDTVGELADAPRSSLALRFGSVLTGHLDRIASRTAEGFEPVLPPTIPHARLAFAEPLGHLGGLEVALKQLAADLCDGLEREDLGAQRIDLRFHRVDGNVAALRVGASRATRDPQHIVRLFGTKLETIDPGFGVEAAVLAATQAEPLEARQVSACFSGEQNGGTADLAALVDRITARIGEGQVYRAAPAESDVPERGVTLVSPLEEATGRSWDQGPRPQRLLDPPEPVEVTALLPDHPPALYVWQGRRMRVTAADGPECVAGEWWLSDAEIFSSRDYFRVEDESGGRAWLFRANASGAAARWFIQGVFA